MSEGEKDGGLVKRSVRPWRGRQAKWGTARWTPEAGTSLPSVTGLRFHRFPFCTTNGLRFLPFSTLLDITTRIHSICTPIDSFPLRNASSHWPIGRAWPRHQSQQSPHSPRCWLRRWLILPALPFRSHGNSLTCVLPQILRTSVYFDIRRAITWLPAQYTIKHSSWNSFAWFW